MQIDKLLMFNLYSVDLNDEFPLYLADSIFPDLYKETTYFSYPNEMLYEYLVNKESPTYWDTVLISAMIWLKQRDEIEPTPEEKKAYNDLTKISKIVIDNMLLRRL